MALLVVPSLAFPNSLPAVVGVPLFLAASIGHACLVLASHNFWYGGHFSRYIMRPVQGLHALVLVGGPLALAWVCGGNIRSLFDATMPEWWRLTLLAYLGLCWFVAFLVLPAITVWRLLRPSPAALLSNHTRTVDVAERLGYKPSGIGRYRRLAQLPGNEIFRVDFSERLLRLPRLPAAWAGLSILHVSDLHLNGTPDRRFFEQVMDHCREWEPDLVAVTGDLVDSEDHYRWVVPVLGRLRWRLAAFAILGNHDRWYDVNLIRRRVRRTGMAYLGNSWVEIEVRGQRLIVIGNEGPWLGPPTDLSSCPAGPFRLCLSHTPDNIRWAQRHHIDLMLAGHVHGGQVRLPLIGPVVIPSRYGRRYDCGVFDVPPTVLHVSRGLSGQEALRYNCRPEVTKLVLEPGGAPLL
jgi:predicted MPP superfamily phosphohydrolase